MKHADSTPRHLIASLALVALAITALSGCASGKSEGAVSAPAESDHSPVGPSPAASVSPGTGVDDHSFVFRISATATTDTGVKARLVETLYAPRAVTTDERKRLSKECRGWGSEFPAGVGMPVELTTTLKSRPWPQGHPVGVVASYLSTAHTYTAATAWTGGGWQEMRAPCSEGGAVIPGSASGILLIDPDATVDSESWGGGSWGFAGNVDVQDPKSAHLVKLSDCRIEIGPAASASARIGAMNSKAATQGCQFGPTS